MMNETLDQNTLFVAGGGEMGELIRAKDWSKTSLGSLDTWPQSLLTTISIILNSKFPMFLWWGPELICFYNDAYRPSLGQNGKHPSILGMTASEAWVEIWDVIKPLIDRVLKGGEATWNEDQLIPIYRNGKMEDVYWTFSYSPVKDESGQPAGVFVTCTETTDKVANLKLISDLNIAMQKLLESEERFRTMAEGSGILIATSDESSNATYFNNAWEVLTGKTMGDLLNFGWTDLIHPEDAHSFVNIYLQAFEKKEPFEGEFRIRDKKGNYRWILTTGPVRYHPDGSFAGYISSSIDITERKNAEENLKLTSERFRLLADSMPQFVWTGDVEGNLNYYNKAVYDYSGLSLEEIQTNGWLQIVHQEEKDENVRLWMESIHTGKDFVFAHRFRRHDGEYRWQLSRAVPQRNADGSIQMWVGTSTDIQDIKEMDQQKDNFLSIASHELKTPVTTIKAYGQIAEGMLERKGDVETSGIVKKMGTQVNRLTNLIEDLLNITKIQKGKLVYNEDFFDFDDLVHEAVDDMQKTSATHTIKNNIGVNAKIYGDKDKISQVLNNLISNAIKYSPQANEVMVITKLINDDVQLSVHDYGIGISEEQQKHVFEQFYRVTGESQSTFPGLGIGLYICSEIISRHHGRIWLESSLGNGSIFNIILPKDHRKISSPGK